MSLTNVGLAPENADCLLYAPDHTSEPNDDVTGRVVVVVVVALLVPTLFVDGTAWRRATCAATCSVIESDAKWLSTMALHRASISSANATFHRSTPSIGGRTGEYDAADDDGDAVLEMRGEEADTLLAGALSSPSAADDSTASHTRCHGELIRLDAVLYAAAALLQDSGLPDADNADELGVEPLPTRSPELEVRRASSAHTHCSTAINSCAVATCARTARLRARTSSMLARSHCNVLC